MARAKKETSANKPATKTAETHYQKLVTECNRLAVLDPPYVWGGGHGGFEYNPTGLDCSGAVSLALHLAGYQLMPMDSGSLASWGEPGKGKVTIWANSEHVFLEFANKQWGWQSPSTGGGWLDLGWNNTADFTPRHPPGLGGPAGQVETGGGSTGEGNQIETGVGVSVAATSKAAAISAFLELPGIVASAESEALSGTKSLLNDQPLFPWIEQITTASLRQFMSMPDGSFYAFIPDYFGGLTKRQAYWDISDSEVIEGMIDLSDDALATHVYIVGDNNANLSVDFIDKIQSVGVVNVINAFQADFITGFNSPKLKEGKAGKGEIEAYEKKIATLPTLADKGKAVNFLKKYGARPYFEEAPMVRSPYYEMFLAYQKFCLLWSEQFEAKFEFTFMPELFPGGIVRFPDYGIQMYVQEVNHAGDYENGFTTRAILTAPSSLNHNGRKGVESGMVRSGLF